MTDRTVKVSLIATVNGYVAGMKQAQQETRKTSTEIEKQAEQHKALQGMVNGTAIAIGAMGAIAAAGIALAVKKFADFDAQMSQVQTLSHATAGEMEELTNAALTMGQQIGFSATEVADAETELVKAGISVKDIIGGALPGALDLAAAGQLDVADATSIAASAMTQFKLSGKDVPHIADLLAAGADKALGSVQDLGQGLKYVGPVADSLGISLDQTVGVLSLLAQNGILADQAGTSLRGMLQSLTSPSSIAAKTMKEYGISVYDASGKFVGLNGVAEQLKTKLGSLDQATRQQALGQIFGNEQITTATVLMQGGAAAVDKWTKSVNDQGFAAEQARGKLDNLNGDLSKLGAAFDTALIKSGSAANDVLRGLVQTATEVIAGFANLPPVFQQGAFALAAVATAATLVGAAGLLIVPKFVEFQSALAVLAESSIPGVGAAAKSMSRSVAAAGDTLAKTAKFLTGPWGVALAAAVVGVDLLSKYLDSLQASSEDITNSLTTAKSAAEIFATAGKGKDVKFFTDVKNDLKDLPDVLQAAADQSSNLFARFDSSHFGAFEALKEIGTQLAALSQEDLPAAQHAFSLLAAQTDGSEKELWRLLNTMPDYKDALVAQASQLGINVTSTDEAANKANLLKLAQEGTSDATNDVSDAIQTMSDKATDAQGDISDLAEAITNFAKGQFDLNSAQRDFEAAIDGVTDTLQRQKDQFIATQKDAYEKAHGSLDGYVASLEGFNTTLDISTENGRENSAALDQIAKSSLELAANTYTQTGSQDQASAAIARGRDELIKALGQFGITGQAAQDYADKLGLIPGNVDTLINLQKTQAEREADAFISKLNSIQRHIDVQVQLHGAENLATTGGFRIANAEGGIIDYYARGGIRERHVAQIAPAGAYRVWAEPETEGEAYIPFAAAKRSRSLAIWRETGKRLGVQGFASGGIVGGASVSVAPIVSLAGATLTLTVDGRQMTAFVQDQIVSNARAEALRTRQG